MPTTTLAGPRSAEFDLVKAIESHPIWTALRGPLTSDSYTYDERYQQLTDNYYGLSANSSGTGNNGTSSTNPLTSVHTYDADGRLASWSRSVINGTTVSSATYTNSYDHDSNRTKYGASTTTYNADNSIATATADPAVGASATSDTYDPDGRLTSDGTSLYGYDSFDRLTCESPTATIGCTRTATAPATGYSYDGLDRQIFRYDGNSTTATGNDFFYEGLSGTTAAVLTGKTGVPGYADDYQILGQNDQQLGVDHTTTVNGTNGPYTITAQSLDGQGNVIAETGTAKADGTPNVVCTTRYDPYGATASLSSQTTLASGCSTGSSTSNQFFQGERQDPTTGNYQLGSRTYQPGTGTFTTPDTTTSPGAGASPSVGTDPLTANTYSYVNGDPINLTDPSGHYACTDEPGRTCGDPETNEAFDRRVQATYQANYNRDDDFTPHGSHADVVGEEARADQRARADAARETVYDILAQPEIDVYQADAAQAAKDKWHHDHSGSGYWTKMVAAGAVSFVAGGVCAAATSETVVGPAACAAGAGALDGALVGGINGCKNAKCYVESAAIGAVTGALTEGLVSSAIGQFADAAAILGSAGLTDAVTTTATDVAAGGTTDALVDATTGSTADSVSTTAGDSAAEGGLATESNLATVSSHLDSIDALASHPPNAAMVSRIQSAMSSGRALTPGEQNFMTHELTEADLMSRGVGQDLAHEMAGQTHPTFGNYDPEVIKQYPEYFNSNWLAYWGLL